MDPEIRNFKELERFINERPKEADALALKWQEFARQNPEVLSIETAEEFYAWAGQNPEKHIDTNIWLGKEIADAYFNLKRQQEDSGTQAQGSDDKKEEEQKERARETPGESIKNIIERIEREERVPQPAAPTTTYQPRIQTPTRGFFNRGIGRGIGGIERGSARLGGRLAGRTSGMAGRLASRLAAQAGMAAGRAVVGALASNPIGWIVIAVIIAIILIVFLIIMFAGGGGIGGGGFQATVECVDPNDPTKSVLVTDGNTCAQNAATFYSNLESIAITTKCLDRCTDFLKTSCERNINNLCSSPDSVCGAPFEAFCVEYAPADAAKKRLYDCVTGGSGYAGFPMFVNCNAPTPTPALGDILFPADSGVIDVKDPLYGAKGDGVTDDTSAIQKAVSDGLLLSKGKEQTAIIYFPAGTYLVSNTILPKIDSTVVGGWRAYLTLQGQQRDKTIIKLKDNAPGYGDKNVPEAVLFTASDCVGCGTNRDWKNLGEGNEAFHNNIFDLTVNTGTGNTGAIGIDYLANNNGSVRNVKIVSGDGQGYVGLSLIRKWPGPALIKNVLIEGFDYGISIAENQYGMTFEHITLQNQKVAGIQNIDNVVSMRDLKSTNSVPVIQNAGSQGLVTLIDGSFTGGSPSVSAIENNAGEVFVRNIAATGYQSAIKNKGSIVPDIFISEFYSLQDDPLYKYSLFDTPEKSLNLPVQETPEVPWDPLDKWISVKDFGANGDGDPSFDNTPKIQAAIDAAASLGKTTLYFPKGQYAFGDTIHIRGNIRRVHFMMSGLDTVNSLDPLVNKFGDGRPLMAIEEGNHPIVVIEAGGGRFNTDSTVKPKFGLKHISSKTLVFKNFGGNYENLVGSGPVFFEDMQGCGIFRSTKAWARQLDPEACAKPPAPAIDPKILNDGSDVWILGIKTEKPAVIVETKNGGRTELLGGLIYPVDLVPATMPAFINTGSSHSLSFVTKASTVAESHEIIVEETRDGLTKQLTKGELPSRGNGVMVPFFAGYK